MAEDSAQQQSQSNHHASQQAPNQQPGMMPPQHQPNQMVPNRDQQADQHAPHQLQQHPMQQYPQQAASMPHNQMGQQQYPGHHQYGQRPQGPQHHDPMHQQLPSGQMPYPAASTQHQGHHPQQQHPVPSQSHPQHQQMAMQQQMSNVQQHHQQGHNPQQAQHASQSRRPQQEQEQTICNRINEDLGHLCHLDNYVGSHSNIEALYKKLQRLQGRGKDIMQGLSGQREKKRDEPPKEISHQDFMMKEMQDMAKDFHEETYFKRYMLAKLAYEAQSVVLKKLREKAGNDFKVHEDNGMVIDNGIGENPGQIPSQTDRVGDPVSGLDNRQDLSGGPMGSQAPDDWGPVPGLPGNPLDDPSDPDNQPPVMPSSSLCALLDGDLGPATSGGQFMPRIEEPWDFADNQNNDPLGGGERVNLAPQSLPPALDLDQELASPENRDVDIRPLEDPELQKEQIDSTKDQRKNDQAASKDAKKGPSHPAYINEDDILVSPVDMIKNLGDIDKRNREFEQITSNGFVDSRYLCYDDTPQDYMIDFPKDELQVKDIIGDGQKDKVSNLYQNQVVKHIESYYEDKFTDLEKKRIQAEDKFKVSQASKFYTDFQFHLGDDKNRADGLNEPLKGGLPPQGPQVNVDSFLRSDPVGQNNLPLGADQMRRDNRGRSTGLDHYDQYGSNRQNQSMNSGNRYGRPGQYGNETGQMGDMNSSSLQRQPNHQMSLGQGYSILNNDGLVDPQRADLYNYQAGSTNQATGNAAAGTNPAAFAYQDELQAEVAFHQDIFQFYEDKLEEVDATRSQTNFQYDAQDLSELRGREQDPQEENAVIQGKNEVQIQGDDASTVGVKNEDKVFDIENQFESFFKTPAKVMKGVYRDGDDFMQDICTKTDRELMRIFPSITEPEHTKVLFGLYLRSKHLEGLTRHVNRVADKNHKLIQQERLGSCREEGIIKQLRAEILKEEEEMWNDHIGYCGKRRHQARDCSQKFKNVYQSSPSTMRDLKRRITREQEGNRRNNNQKQPQIFTDGEVAFIRWYVSIFGDNWRLIAHVLNYHPFTRGYIRSKDSVQTQFIHYMNAATHANLLHEGSVIKPWRTTAQPVLITERPPSLYCSIKQINQMHHICIKNNDIKRLNPTKVHVFQLYQDQDGMLKIRYTGPRKVKKAIQEEPLQKKEIIGKRESGVVQQEDELRADEEDQIDAQIAKVTRAEGESPREVEMEDEEAESFTSQFYLGQKIDEVLKGDLKRPSPNFSFQSCQSRRTPFSKLCYSLKRQRCGQNEEVKVQRSIQQVADPSAQIPVTQEEMNTPMFCALHENKTNHRSAYQKSVLHQSGIMFWLGYLYKKIAQNRRVQKVRLMNERSFADLKDYEKALPQQISTMHTREARKTRLEYLQKRNGLDAQGRAAVRNFPPQPDAQELKIKRRLEADLEGYSVERSAGLVQPSEPRDGEVTPVGGNPQNWAQGQAQTGHYRDEEVRFLWPQDRQSIFYYDPERLNEYLQQEEHESRVERRLDSIIDIMETKWARMDRYWFQKHRHLDQKMRKKKDYPQIAAQSNMPHPASGATDHGGLSAQYRPSGTDSSTHPGQYPPQQNVPPQSGMQPPLAGQPYIGRVPPTAHNPQANPGRDRGNPLDIPQSAHQMNPGPQGGPRNYPPQMPGPQGAMLPPGNPGVPNVPHGHQPGMPQPHYPQMGPQMMPNDGMRGMPPHPAQGRGHPQQMGHPSMPQPGDPRQLPENPSKPPDGDLGGGPVGDIGGQGPYGHP